MTRHQVPLVSSTNQNNSDFCGGRSPKPEGELVIKEEQPEDLSIVSGESFNQCNHFFLVIRIKHASCLMPYISERDVSIIDPAND